MEISGDENVRRIAGKIKYRGGENREEEQRIRSIGRNGRRECSLMGIKLI